jgi:hypothetical protein
MQRNAYLGINDRLDRAERVRLGYNSKYCRAICELDRGCVA